MKGKLHKLKMSRSSSDVDQLERGRGHRSLDVTMNRRPSLAADAWPPLVRNRRDHASSLL
jgi:hypothetical protein